MSRKAKLYNNCFHCLGAQSDGWCSRGEDRRASYPHSPAHTHAVRPVLLCLEKERHSILDLVQTDELHVCCLNRIAS